jgi:hypothetical protein
MALNLIIGNKNYSSWSLRPWIAMRTAGIEFTEQVISLDDPDFKRTVQAISPAGSCSRSDRSAARLRQQVPPAGPCDHAAMSA